MQSPRRFELIILYTDLIHISSPLDRGGRCAGNIVMRGLYYSETGVVFHNEKNYFLVKNV